MLDDGWLIALVLYAACVMGPNKIF